MSAAVCYFLVYFSEALILLQYSSNVFEYKISSIKRYITYNTIYPNIFYFIRTHCFIKHCLIFCCYFCFFENFNHGK